MAFSKGKSAPTPGEAQRNTRPNWHATRRSAPKPSLQASDVLANTDIVSLIGEIVELRPRGAEWVGLCPFHDDSKPSFEVNGAKGIYSCWSCSAGLKGSKGGDAITFVRRYHDMDFTEALNYLAKRAGMAVPDGEVIGTPKANPNPAFVPRHNTETVPQKKEPNLKAPKEPLYALMQTAQDLFSTELVNSPEIIKYLTQERDIDPSLLGVYRIGYAPDSFGRLRSKVSDYNTSEPLFDAGLVKETSQGRRYDFFRNRLTFGVRDDEGRIIAFGGRRVGDSPKLDAKGKEIPVAKYLNSPETAIFNKREVLFGWYEASQSIKESGYALMVEGYMDVLGLASHGIMNSAACMGTALTENHVEAILSRVRRVVFCFDGDDAGQQAGFRTLSALFPHLDNDVQVNFLTLPDGLDPDEYVRKHGKTAFLKRVNDSDSLASFWDQALRRLYPEPKDHENLWRNAKELVKLLPEDSHHRDALMRIAAHLSGESFSPRQPKAPPPPSARAKCSGLSSFVANEPSDRLYLAVMKMPQLGAEIRPRLVDLQQTASPSLMPELAAWQSKYDQSMAAGMSQIAEAGQGLSDQERRQYEAVVRAAPSILSQFLAHKEREKLDKALEAGELNEQDYLSKLRGSTFARPR